MAVTSGSGNRLRPPNVNIIAAVPKKPRQKWPFILFGISASPNSPRCQIQVTMIGSAKNDLKKTASPGGTSCVATFIIAAITINRKTANSFNAIAVLGLLCVQGRNIICRS